MGYYLVTAILAVDLQELRRRLDTGDVRRRRPYGPELSFALDTARVLPDGRVAWEQFDIYVPPLERERREVLDGMFEDIRAEPVDFGEGWMAIARHPSLWSDLESRGSRRSDDAFRKQHGYSIARSLAPGTVAERVEG